MITEVLSAIVKKLKERKWKNNKLR